ncbi:GNAT family N-acetyltransferase [Methylomonas sp. EFPC3]|uniref:GNAT family N-acetyltransferase n=1 Tax=Methylomonas sp. EFPC3 TaxID=3021710 RepID=UPI002415C519|nr:GNAT family N-acetyltransferase [Methylomonas sp. EFPC3]WFP48935.1 GNAT family N-acetyltransferase [Methylomonas sp. EFPC3]
MSESLEYIKDLLLSDGLPADAEWLFDLYRQSMRDCVEATWGWDEDFQKSGFNQNLKPSDWQVIWLGEHRIGGFVLNECSDHLRLAMIMLEPEYRRQGLGRKILTHIQQVARQKALPVRLNVIKANPVLPFYTKLGFRQYAEDEACFRLQWDA